MCGRFTLAKTGEVAAAFDVPDPPPLTPRYNVAPSQVIAVVGLKHDARKRGIALLRWGLVPYWAANPNSGPRPINVRSESVLSKFGEQLRERRCLIPADGFYEWKTVGKKKVPHRFTMLTGEPFAFAGLWDVWRGEREKLVTCCLLTTMANDLVRPVHDRMPVIVPPEGYGRLARPGHAGGDAGVDAEAVPRRADAGGRGRGGRKLAEERRAGVPRSRVTGRQNRRPSPSQKAP